MPQDPYAEFGGSQVNSTPDPYAEFGGKADMSIPGLIAPSPFGPKPPTPPSTLEGIKGLGKGVLREIIQPEGGFGNQLPQSLSALAYSNPTQAAVGNRVSDMSTAVGLTEGIKGLGSLGMDVYSAVRAKGAEQALIDAAKANPLARLITKAERPTGPIRGGSPPIKTKTGISEQDLQAIREGGAYTRRSSEQFVQDVIRRRGLPVAPQMADIEAAVKGRAIEMAQKYPVPKFESLKDPFAAPEGTVSGYPKTPDPYIGKNVPEMQPVQSTNIAKAGYHPDSQTMMLEFKNGRVHQYSGVPAKEWEGFQNAESHGSYFSQNIKGKYPTKYRGSVLGKQVKAMAAD